MKNVYVSPEAQVIDLAAMECIAVLDGTDGDRASRASSGNSTGILNPSGGFSEGRD